MIDRFRSKKEYATVRQDKGMIGASQIPKRMLVIINGRNQESWPNAMQLYCFIRDKLKDKIDSLRMADPQDSKGKWTLRLIVEFSSDRRHLEKAIKDRAKTITTNPEPGYMKGGIGPGVEFQDTE